MSKGGIEDYLRELSRHLSAGPRRRHRIMAEVRDHLQRKIEDEKAKGTDPEIAEALAISEFGEPAATGRRISPPISPSVPVPFPMGGHPATDLMPPLRRRQSKTVLLVYGVIGLLVLSVVAAMALVFVPPSPPTISEFQPLAQKEIQEAPTQQSSQFGSGGAGLCAAGQTCVEPQSASAVQKQVIEKARVRRCIGNPPRQTEDPQSPPCVNFWQGDNGGATTKGVTRDEIRVAANVNGGFGGFGHLQGLASYFNSRYEFYGRKIRLVDFEVVQPDATTQRVAAQKAAQELDVFAVLDNSRTYNNLSWDPYRRELARLGVMSVFGRELAGTTTDLLDQLSPFAWDYYVPPDLENQNLTEYACKALVGRPAKWAGPELQLRERLCGGFLHLSKVRGTGHHSASAGARKMRCIFASGQRR
jgi:HAAS domain-containing protein